MKMNQKGNGALVIILTVLILVLIGGGILIVWRTNYKNKVIQRTSVSNTNTSPSQTTSSVKAPTETNNDIKTLSAPDYKTVSYTSAPQSIRDAINEHWVCRDSPAKRDGYTVAYTSKFFEADFGCDGGSSELFLLSNGSWTVIHVSTEGTIKCELIVKNSIPVEFFDGSNLFGNQCIDAQNKLHGIVKV